MNRFTYLLSLLLVLLFALPAAADPINAVAGDRSWTELGHGARDQASDAERIRTHLAWVEAELRAADISTLSAEASARRASLLDVLSEYRMAGAFPQHELAGEGRQPRWVDHEGRLCAVGHLVASTGEDLLFDQVAAAHEYDFVADMKVPELAAWASAHGFTVTELAMIQPSYRWGSVGPQPEHPMDRERREREEERKRHIPRPLPPEEVDSVIESLTQDRDAKRACFKKQTGRWAMKASATITRKATARVRVEVTPEGSTRTLEAESRCLASKLDELLKAHLTSVHYTVEKSFVRTHEVVFDIPDHEAIVEGFFAREAYATHFGKTRREGVAACFADAPTEDVALSVPVLVSSWNGEVRFRWNRIPKAEDRETRELWQCVQSVLIYERSGTFGIWDHKFTLEVRADGAVEVK